jgi:heterodisulfide reductase subunit C
MASRLSFADEVANLLYATEGSPISACIQCGTCAATCPAVDFMDHSPRELIALIRAERKREVLSSNTFWCCASCYACTVRCPKGIDIAYMMYGLKRYSMWRNGIGRHAIGPDFSKRFVRMIVKHGRSYEPGLVAPYIFRNGLRAMLYEALTALHMVRTHRLPVIPHRVKRSANFRGMLSRIIPVGRQA